VSGTISALAATAQAMVTPGRGIAALDESFGTANKRFSPLGIPTTAEMRRAYREMLLTTPGIGEFISGQFCLMKLFVKAPATAYPLHRSCRQRG
jgi:fructose-bisphosphate aldolase, class I